MYHTIAGQWHVAEPPSTPTTLSVDLEDRHHGSASGTTAYQTILAGGRVAPASQGRSTLLGGLM